MRISTIPDLGKAMIFVDGTRLFSRLRAEKIKIPNLKASFTGYMDFNKIFRTYVYTTPPYLEQATEEHGEAFLLGSTVILGDAVVKRDGNTKEKGVDALLVADLIFHAASKNLDFAILVSVDEGFTYAIDRAKDFGCRTGIIGFCSAIPKRLVEVCDFTELIKTEDLLTMHTAYPSR
jgi:uncharacterized LabA/DUF88 family protein